jgi:hypothetical protein
MCLLKLTVLGLEELVRLPGALVVTSNKCTSSSCSTLRHCFWEWLGQNTSVGVSPETFLLLLLLHLSVSDLGEIYCECLEILSTVVLEQ